MRKSSMSMVTESFSAKRKKAIDESKRRRIEVQSLLPEISEIDRKLELTSLELMGAAMSGGNVDEKIAEIKKRTALLRQSRGEILVANGFPADYTDVKFECEDCGDTGFLGIKMCRCMKKAVALAAIEDSGIGELVKKQNFESFSFDFYEGDSLRFAKVNFETLKKFAENFDARSSENFILMGNTGLGKTHLSTSVAKVVIEKGYRVAYDTISDIMGDFEANRFRDADDREYVTDEEIRRRYYDSDLLIIDDLGCEMSNQFTVSCVYNIVNNRINSGRSTIINTNLTQGELRDKYADRIVSRIFGEYRPLLFKGDDIRAQKLRR